MTEQEQQLINGLSEQIRNAPAPQIDRDANNLIQRTIGARSDALYILTQTVIVQQMALDQAKAQIDDLKRQTAPQPQPGFLPGSPQPPYQGGYRGSSYQNSAYAVPPPQEPAPPPQPSGGGLSGFLHNVATTAAGVIAGEVAFDALSSLFGGHRGYYGGGGFLGGGGGETIVNNYYEDDRRDRDDRDDDSRFAQAADQDQDISPDIDDERDNSGDSFDDDSSDSSSFDDSSS